MIGPIGPNKTSRGNRYLIVAIDHFSKWVEAKAIPAPTAKHTARFIVSHILANHGCPHTILTDNGTNFTSDLLVELNTVMGIKDAKSTPYHLKTNGSVERVNGTLKTILKKLMLDSGSSWDTLVPLALMAYRVTVHTATGCSPFQMVYGRQPALPGLLATYQPDHAILPDEHLKTLTKGLITLHQEAYNYMRKVRGAAFERDIKHRPCFTTLRSDSMF